MVYNNHNSTYCNTNRYNRRHLLLNYRLEHQCKYRSNNTKYKYSRHLHSKLHNSRFRRLCSSYKNNNSKHHSSTKCKYKLYRLSIL